MKRGRFAAHFAEGGPGSGNFGHAGRKGVVGGSAPGGDLTHKRVVFTMGGGGSGKGLITRKYRERFGITHTINSDDIKKTMPLYSYKPGERPGASKSNPQPALKPNMYGPSGPRTMAEYMQYTPQERASMESFIQNNTKFSGSREFAQYLQDNHPEDTVGGKTFAGGLTHEVSSYIAKTELEQAIASGDHSIIYDSTGSRAIADKYGPWALSRGFKVDIHKVSTDPEVAQMWNDRRERSVSPDMLAQTHEKVAAAAPYVRSWAHSYAGRGVTFRDTRGNKISDLRSAQSFEPRAWSGGQPRAYSARGMRTHEKAA